MKIIALQGRQIGGGARCFVIAEAGVNHDGDLAVAHQLVDAAADARADAVKFQTFAPDALASANAPKAAYQLRRTAGAESQREMLRRLSLSREAHVALKDHAERRGLLFLSTPFDEGSADFLEQLGVAAFKVASGEITNHAFLRHLGRKGKPLLLSTGMSDLAEVAAAVHAAAAPSLALLHCLSSYPAPPEQANLRAMETLRRSFEVPVGYSDHTLGSAVMLASVALGAALVEKHLTLGRDRSGPDHAASAEPLEFRALVEQIRFVESALGDGVKSVQPAERETRAVARKSLFAARDLFRGERIDEHALRAQRPGTGISPSRLPALIGRVLTRDLPEGALLSESDFRG